ncbi:MAG: exopolysaccharide biosynthesis polyprenyl glycosylphosphotransferase [Gammaproteobacteria bacterium]|nr:exopolysaccharide biosynthesis polyprenyl glycosylphosphotransferase [Gammaproteobacteria bacterium]
MNPASQALPCTQPSSLASHHVPLRDPLAAEPAASDLQPPAHHSPGVPRKPFRRGRRGPAGNATPAAVIATTPGFEPGDNGRVVTHGRLRAFAKRAYDIVAALALLALAWPVMLLAALLVASEGAGPVFYRQDRVGLHGRIFSLVKFRSMRTDAESDGIPCWASHGDPRVTRVGRVLRTLRIDELPQLWNVLRGEMSLVGPRPERPYFVARLALELPQYDSRHRVKPGLTGWAQVSYRYGDSIEDAAQKLRYDLHYVSHQSLCFDSRILFSTVPVVLRGTGAR